MVKKLKHLMLSTCAVFLLFGLIGKVLLNESTTIASANEIDLTVEDYTETDYLIKANGDESSKTISVFANEVKNASVDTSFPELTEVIPKEYLESTTTNDTFYYNGKEYGFYVAKEGDYFDVLLIDFKYEFDNGQESDVEYKIRVEPILQQSFYRSQIADGIYEWRKYTEGRYTYYVANPRFLTLVQNENALNYGDEGYSKYNDDGVIILQSRANYGKVSYKTGTDLLGNVLEFAGKQILDKAVDALSAVTYGIAGIIADTLELGVDLYQESKEVILETNNEKNIFTRQSKTAQRDNDAIDGFSRTAAFMPTEEIVLSADVNSYAEFITVLNDANYRTRISEFCDFDIVRRNSSYSSMEYVTGADENKVFSFKKVSTVYDDKTVTELDSDVVTQNALVYLLENGTHKFSYECLDSTDFQIEANTSLPNIDVFCGEEKIPVISVNDNIIEFAFEKGKKYEIIFSQEIAEYYYFSFYKKSEGINAFGDKTMESLKGEGSKWYKYVSSVNQYLSLEYDESKYALNVFSLEKNGYIEFNGVQNQKEFYVEQGNTYYIGFSNKTTEVLESTIWAFNEVDELPCNSESNVFSVNEERVFKFVAPIQGKYVITGLSSDVTATIDGSYDGSNYVLESDQYYVTIKGNSASATCKIGFASQDAIVGVSNVISGDCKSVFIKFVPLQTLRYDLILPTDVSLEQIIENNEITNVNIENDIQLNANTLYYFRLVATSGNLPASFEMSISPTCIDSIIVNEDMGTGSKTITGTGTQVVEIIINETNIYSFNGLSNYSLYNQYLQLVDSNSVLTVGKYYVKANFVSGIAYTLEVSKTGLNMQIGDVIGLTSSATYKYELVKGQQYEIRIGASADHTFTTDITLKNSSNETCTVTKTNDYYMFTANDTTMFVNLTMNNVSGQAGIFTLLETNTTAENVIQELQPDHLYPLATNQSKCIVRIPAGTYKLYIQKKVGETVKLYELDSNTTTEYSGDFVGGTTLANSTAIEYTLNLVFEKKYIVFSDNIEVDCLLSYADGSEYCIRIKGEAPQTQKLSIYNSYEFELYRYTNEEQYLVSDIGSEDFKVYEGTNGAAMNGVAGVYTFNKIGDVYISIDFFGISSHATYSVVKPKIKGNYEVTENGLYFKTSPLDYVSDKYEFKNVRLALFADEQYRFTGTYSNADIFKDITSYVWYKNLVMEVTFTYGNDEKTVVFSAEFEYSIPYYKIDGGIAFGNNEIAIIDASLISGGSYILNKRIIIPDTIKQIFFLGQSYKTVIDLDILVVTRSTVLEMYMNNFSYTFKENGLYVEGRSSLRLDISGECSILPKVENEKDLISRYGLYGYAIEISGAGALQVRSGKQKSSSTYTETEGLPGIIASDLTISIKKLMVKGGTGGDAPAAEGTEYANDLSGKSGNPGGIGGYAIFVTRKLNVTSSCQILVLISGNGGDGGDGANGLDGTEDFEVGGSGGHGGDGGAAGYYFHQNLQPSSVTFPSTTNVQYIAGIRGNGGRGGNGGNGGTGADGGHGGNGGDGYCGGEGGHGGNGGHGASDTSTSAKASNGGNGGNGGHGGYSDSTQLYEKPGDGGNGGNGGNPGAIGHGKNGGNGGIGYNGGNGGAGSNSKAWFTHGGNGGTGGDAYGGAVGLGGAGGSGKSSDGSSGSDGISYSDYQDYPHWT